MQRRTLVYCVTSLGTALGFWACQGGGSDTYVPAPTTDSGLGGEGGNSAEAGAPGAPGGTSNTAGGGSGGGSSDGGAGGDSGSVCEPGAETCVGNVVALCADTGGGYASFESCEANQTCVQDADGARCEDQVCEPSSVACATQRVIRQCSDDGLTFNLVDCEPMNQYCVDGACSDQLCTPNAQFCSDNAIHECNADGSASEVLTPCAGDQYCNDSAATPTCSTQVCTPNQSICELNFAKTCNASGSGYVGPGEDCEQRGCALGVCRSLLYAEDFESGTQGNVLFGVYTNTISGAAAANGTNYGYRMVGQTTQPNGAFAILPSVVPTYVSYWVRPHAANVRSAYFTLTSSEDALASNRIVEVLFHSTGWIRVNISSAVDIVTYQANQWYHVELDIDWTGRSVGLTINDQSYGAYPIYDTNATSVRSFWLWNSESSTTDWDEIVIR